MISCLKEKSERENGRQISRKDSVKYKKYNRNEKLREWAANKTKQANAQMTTFQSNRKNSSVTNNSTPNSSLSFFSKKTLYRSVERADLHL